MKIVVVYESMFGNTKTIGEGIAEGLGESGEVIAGTVDEVSPDEVGDAALIVAGGRPSTPVSTSRSGSPALRRRRSRAG